MTVMGGGFSSPDAPRGTGGHKSKSKCRTIDPGPTNPVISLRPTHLYNARMPPLAACRSTAVTSYMRLSLQTAKLIMLISDARAPPASCLLSLSVTNGSLADGIHSGLTPPG